MIDKKSISVEMLEDFSKQYHKDPKNEAVAGAIATVGIDDSAQNPECLRAHDFFFSDECKQGDITNQKKSGRCWIFASLNMLRGAVMDKLNVENLEFAQSYLYFYDKLEKSNSFLERVIETVDEPDDSRLFHALFDFPSVQDGGYWHFFKSLVKKYGMVPKSAMPDTYHPTNSDPFSEQIDRRIKAYAMKIRAMAKGGKEEEDLRKVKKEALADIYNICVKVFGEPIKSFDFHYRDKDKKVHVDRNLTPMAFYEKYIGDEVLDEKITLVADPRHKYPQGRVLESEFATSIYGVSYKALNVPMEEMVKALLKSIKAGKPTWFACDVGKDSNRKLGILDTDLHNYDEILPPVIPFTKENRLICDYSNATHAMNITGVECDADGKPLRWKVENSWGDEVGSKGIFSMSNDWFEEYAYELIVDKAFVSDEYLKGLDQEAIQFEYYDILCKMLSATR